MISTWIVVAIGIAVLVAAIPYVARIRHARQKPLAAYLIFASVFVAVAGVSFNLVVWLIVQAGQSAMLSVPWLAVMIVLLVFVVSFLLATWLARKPPRSPRAPD